MKLFHPSVEGAQHGAKGLKGFLDFAAKAGALGAQPSNSMLEKEGGGFLPVVEIQKEFQDRNLKLDGVSAHCPFWVHTTAWTGSPTIKKFLPPDVASRSLEDIEAWAENYCLKLLDLCAELNIKVVPMFWGTAYGWEVATGYPWGFWKGPGYDLIAEGDERFVKKTQKLRDKATNLRIVLAHEIHPGTAASCARDFLTLVDICDNEGCLGVNADPSHCWGGESWQRRCELVGDRIYGCHVKNHHVRPGLPLRCMEPDWQKRSMQFTQLDRGDIDMVRYVEAMINAGYPQNYCQQQETETAPLVVEAEGAYADLDQVSAEGIAFVRDVCCFDVAEASFEEGMGEQE